jgi:hypothetical protein
MTKGLGTFDRRLLNCKNPSQMATFYHSSGGAIARIKRAGAMIGVQPTSASRRAAGRSRGKRVQSTGRNAKVRDPAAKLLATAKARKAAHNISANIKKNVPNYRKH